MRAILDTNILISALLRPSSIPATLVDAWLERRFVLISHSLQMDEFRAVTRRPRIQVRIRRGDAGRLANQLLRVAEQPTSLPFVERSADPCDDFLLALCEAGRADWLVTGDRDDLLVLGRHGPTRIVTANYFAVELGLGAGPSTVG